MRRVSGSCCRAWPASTSPCRPPARPSWCAQRLGPCHPRDATAGRRPGAHRPDRAAFRVRFLRLMIAHYEGAVSMCQEAGVTPSIRACACWPPRSSTPRRDNSGGCAPCWTEVADPLGQRLQGLRWPVTHHGSPCWTSRGSAGLKTASRFGAHGWPASPEPSGRLADGDSAGILPRPSRNDRHIAHTAFCGDAGPAGRRGSAARSGIDARQARRGESPRQSQYASAFPYLPADPPNRPPALKLGALQSLRPLQASADRGLGVARADATSPAAAAGLVCCCGQASWPRTAPLGKGALWTLT
jgi:hypothetical protein